MWTSFYLPVLVFDFICDKSFPSPEMRILSRQEKNCIIGENERHLERTNKYYSSSKFLNITSTEEETLDDTAVERSH